MKPRLSIIVPAYQEAPRIAQSLQQLAQAIDKYLDPKTIEVVVVSADGKDDTAQIAQQQAHLFAAFKLVQPGPRVGKGRDVRSGMQAATGEYKLFMDADMATPLHHLQQINEFMTNNGQIGIGIRPLASIHTGLRKYISEFGNLLVQTILTPGISDSQCGFKVFRSDCAQVLFDRLTILGWGFDMELLVIARVHNYSITNLPINDWHDPKADEGLSGDSSLKVALDTGLELLTIVANRLRGRYR